MADADHTAPRASRLTTVLFLFGVAYFLSLFFRTVNAILSARLEVDLVLDAASLGLLTAAYFLGGGLAQIPIGICLDAYGPRRVQTVMLCIAATGIAGFGLFESVPMLVISRLLIGVGMAGCLTTAFQVSVLWLTSDKVPLANGLFLAVGGLGALAATAPVNSALEVMTWQQLFLMIAVVTLLVAAAIAIVTPEPPLAPRLSWRDRLRSVGLVTRNQQLRRYMPLSALCFGTGTALQGLWAADWMRTVGQLTPDVIAWTLAMMAVALTVGSAAGGVLTLVIERRGLQLTHVILGSAVLFILAEIGLVLLPPSAALAPWLLFALSYNVVTLSYAHVSRSQPKGSVGITIAFMNTVVILTTFAIQYGLGLFFSWSGEGNSVGAYAWAFLSLIGAQILTLIWCCFPRGQAHPI